MWFRSMFMHRKAILSFYRVFNVAYTDDINKTVLWFLAVNWPILTQYFITSIQIN